MNLSNWKAGIAILISDSTEIREKTCQDNKDHYLMVKRTVHHENKKFWTSLHLKINSECREKSITKSNQ